MARLTGIVIVAGLLVAGASTGGLQASRVQGQANASPQGNAAARPFLDQYCVSCHNDRLKTAGLSLESADPTGVSGKEEVWERVVRKLRADAMPPQGQRRADKATTHQFIVALETTLDRAAFSKPNPGRVPALHRLNRAEYSNVVRDVLSLDLDMDSWLPPDDSSYGFDNIADALSVSPLLMERYLSAARTISRLTVGSRDIHPSVTTYPVSPELTQDDHIDGLPFGTRGGALAKHYMPLDGDYEIKITLLRSVIDSVRGLQEPNQLEVSVDGERVKLFTVGEKSSAEPQPSRKEGQTEDEAEAARQAARDAGVQRAFEQMTADAGLKVRVPLKAGPHAVGVAFLKKTAAEIEDVREPLLRSYFDPTEQDGQPHVRSIAIGGPYNATGPGETPSRRRIFVCTPAAPAEEGSCAKTIITTLARRMYRRPVADADRTRLLEFFATGRAQGGFDAGIEYVVRRLLVSPEFLFRVERDPAGIAPSTPYAISNLELASRLSFFLWSSAPDDELLDLAERGRLGDASVLERQVRRMLKDARSRSMVTNFGGQWLYLRNLAVTSPDPLLFPDFDDNLRDAMRKETELFFERVIREDRSIRDFLTSNTTFVNERLARHYGIPNVYGSHFRQVTLADGHRAGLLGHASLLTATSYANRTSPVLRGKWVLENIIGAPPPPPPPAVPALVETTGDGQPRSMRDAMEQHRKNPACASCHLRMDPLGFALENFDAVGRWRTLSESNEPIDASGALPDGSRFQGAQGLRNALASRSEIFASTFTEKLLTYALGRGIEMADAPTVRQIANRAAADDYRFSALVLGIVKSTPFKLRRSQS